MLKANRAQADVRRFLFSLELCRISMFRYRKSSRKSRIYSWRGVPGVVLAPHLLIVVSLSSRARII